MDEYPYHPPWILHSRRSQNEIMANSLAAMTTGILMNRTSRTNGMEIIRYQNTPAIHFAMKTNEELVKWIESNGQMLLSFVSFAKTLNHAAGLASNQVAWQGTRLTDRFFVMRFENEKDFRLIINPHTEEKIGHPKEMIEACFTWPGKKISVIRHPQIAVSYYSDGITKNLILSGQDAQVWQHEMDHLDGVEWSFVMEGNPYHKQMEKTGRNDPCPCGSGKKYKKCCGAT